MTHDVITPPWEPEVSVEDVGHGCYNLLIDRVPLVRIVWLNGVRQARWEVYGPADLTKSIAIMKGFLHLTALLGNETRAYTRPPDLEEPSESQGAKKWRTSKTTRKSRT